ncbi:MAG: hypothetical protein JWQ25_2458, partial [Daejeonella sp.]|nr:hypothetical protein [Daejeonella sp.]
IAVTLTEWNNAEHTYTHYNDNTNLLSLKHYTFLTETVGSGGGATVYVESDGVGHVYLEVNGTVFSYGRYDGSYSPSSGSLGPIGNGVLLKKDHSYAAERMKKYPTSVYQFPNASGAAIYNHLNGTWENGTPSKHGGMVVGTYVLAGNNCSTTTCDALKIGGIDIPRIQTPAGFNIYMKPYSPATNSYTNSFGQH